MAEIPGIFSYVGIGTDAPTNPLEVLKTQNAATYALITNASAGTASEAKLGTSNGTDLVDFGITGTGFTPSGIFGPRIGFMHTNALNGLRFGSNTGPVVVSATGNINFETARFENGLFCIGFGNGVSPTYAMDVQSTAATGNATGYRLYRSTAGVGDTNTFLFQANTLNTCSISDEVTSGTTGSIIFSTNNGAGLVKRWKINPAGDLCLGNGNIVYSIGGPVITSGGGAGATIAGNDSSFAITLGAAPASTAIVITFGHAFTNAPAPGISWNATSGNPNRVQAAPTTTTLTLTPVDAPWIGGSIIYGTATGH